jgi:hypothetical protein
MVITAEDKLREIERELKMRRRLYPQWIARGQLDERDAKRRIEVMQAIALEYEALAQKERLL